MTATMVEAVAAEVAEVAEEEEVAEVAEAAEAAARAAVPQVPAGAVAEPGNTSGVNGSGHGNSNNAASPSVAAPAPPRRRHVAPGSSRSVLLPLRRLHPRLLLPDQMSVRASSSSLA
ncbi:MAG: hypothetical protein ACRC7C_03735 [Beijerinckiaceae bacterium]